MPYFILIILWLGWCALHSLLITKNVTGYLQPRLGRWVPYYRLFYNCIALLTLIPVLGYTLSMEGTIVFYWQGGFRIIQALLLVLASFFFIAGANRYDMAQFLGLRQIRADKACSALTDDCLLDTKGILNVVRHPWYTGGILLVWSRDLRVETVLVNLVISGYFIIGAVLEERKLVGEYGTEYKAYQQRVSMLVPIKWLLKKWTK